MISAEIALYGDNVDWEESSGGAPRKLTSILRRSIGFLIWRCHILDWVEMLLVDSNADFFIEVRELEIVSSRRPFEYCTNPSAIYKSHRKLERFVVESFRGSAKNSLRNPHQ